MGLDWLYIVCLPFTVAGAFLVLRQKEKRRSPWLLIFPVIGVAVISAITFGDPRFRHPVDFCLIVLSALGISGVFDRIKLLVSN